MYSYGETGETMYFLWGDNVFLWERQFIFKYKPDFGLIGRSSVMVQYSFSKFRKTTQPFHGPPTHPYIKL